MRTIIGLSAGIGLLALSHSAASAANLRLQEYAFIINGQAYVDPANDDDPAALPLSSFPGNTSAFNPVTGLGTVTLTVSNPGQYDVAMYVDHDIFEQGVNGIDNEVGVVTGVPAPGQSWEIDEPGFRALSPGDIYANFKAFSLDETNGSTSPDDVSMALAFSFVLAANETGTLTFVLAQALDPTAFTLELFDPDADQSVYFSASLKTIQPIPLPPAAVLFGSALLALAAARRRHAR